MTERDGRPNGLSSLYGDGHANATRARECVAMPGLREQEILTPPPILNVCKRLWGFISLDPCCPVGANPCEAASTYDGKDRDGKIEKWLEGTFWNPPFGELEQWMLKASGERVEQIGLIPCRTHRRWFREHLQPFQVVVWLNPVTFLGFDQSFPAPLVLVYRGLRAADFARLAQHLGSVTLNPWAGLASLQIGLFT